jgi:hypothetical protein
MTQKAWITTIAAMAFLATGTEYGNASNQWQFVNVTSVDNSGKRLAGRINAAVQDPNDPNVMYIATDGARPTSANGGNPDGEESVGLSDTGGAGIWKTKNWLHENPHWVPLTDDQPSPSVGVHGLVMSPTHPTILYAAADGPQGCILKTEDTGEHWKAFAQEIFDGVKFGGIAVHPVNPNIVYVGVFRPGVNTPGGVYKSTDGGKTWTLTANMQGDVSHVMIDPNNPDTLWAGFVDPNNTAQQGVWKSVNGGSSWQQQNANFPAGTFHSVLYIEFVIAPSDSHYMYAIVMQPQNKPLPAFYSTSNAGANWGPICPTDERPDNRYWHQPLTVHPQNPQFVYAEGFNHHAVFSSTGGQPHPGVSTCDHVWTTFWTNDDPAGFTFSADAQSFAAFGDRGIYRVVNVTHPHELTDFEHKQGDLSNLLLVSLSAHPVNSKQLYGIAFDQLRAMGANDSSPFWTYLPVGNQSDSKLFGSEFGRTIFNPVHPSIAYNLTTEGLGSTNFTNFIRRLDNGRWDIISNGFASTDFPFSRAIQTDAAAWKAIEFDPISTEGLLYGGVRVWAWTKSSNTFTPISPDLVNSSKNTSSFISAIGISQSNPNRVYVGTSEATLYVTSDRITWSPVNSLTLPQSSFVARISVDPSDPDIVLIAVQGAFGSGRVWITNNGGSNWTDITTNLPTGLQVYSLIVDWRFKNPPLFLGTDRSVYEARLNRTDSGLTVDLPRTKWSRFGKGLPNTLVSDLNISTSGVMTAGLYGRGVFQIQLPKR